MLSPVQRGDVYLADLSPVQGSEQDGQRPVVVISRDAINNNSPIVVVVPCTDAANKKKFYPSHVRIKAGAGGLTMDSVVLCERVRAISKDRLKKHMGTLSRSEIAGIEASLKITLDLS